MTISCKTRVILIVEDETEISRFASRVLELEGYRVICAACVDEALKSIEQNHIDLVLLDLTLPGKDGWSLLQEVRGTASIPVIIFTASASLSQRNTAIEDGAAQYLVKPLSAGTLRDAVADALAIWS